MRLRFLHAAFGLAALGACASGPPPGALVDDAAFVPLEAFDLSAYEDAFLADQVVGARVVGPSGEGIGEVSDLIVGPDDRLRAVIVERGGVLGFGEETFAVPWAQVDTTPGEDGVRVSGERTTAGVDAAALEREGAFRASDLIGETASLTDEPGYGAVSDLVFDRDGALRAVVVSPNIGYAGPPGVRAYPYYGGYEAVPGGFGYRPGFATYALPYSGADLVDYGPFDPTPYRDPL